MAFDTEIGGSRRVFPSTQWTLIRSAKAQSEEELRNAMADLLTLYWKPIYVVLRSKGFDSEESKDITQDFILHILEKDLQKLTRSRGKFRSYLRSALDNFLVNRAEYQGAQKRGGGALQLSLDYASSETSYNLQVTGKSFVANDVFDKEWAFGIYNRATQFLKEEIDKKYGDKVFKTLQEFFSPAGNPISQEEAAKKLGMSDGQFRVFLHRARTQLKEFIRDQVRATVEDESEVQGEMEELLKILTA